MRKAFTLIELLVVIAIIALLLSIVMPALSKVKEVGRRTVCMTRAKGIGAAIHVYAVENKDNIPSTTSQMNAAWNNWVYYFNPASGIPPSQGWYGLGLLHKEKLVEEREAFYCPSQKHPQLAPDLYFPAKKFSGYDGNLPRNFTGNICLAAGSLAYGIPGEVTDRPSLSLQETKLSKLKDLPLVTDVFIPLRSGPDFWEGPYRSSFAHTGKKGGLTVAFGDGHCEFVKLSKTVFDLTNEQKAYEGDHTLLHRADHFAATMYRLLCGNPKYMSQDFNNGDPIDMK